MVEDLRPVLPARAVAPYVGGKRQLAAEIVRRIEQIPHNLYGEVFAGMAGVFFRRRLAPKVEVLNDISRDVANLFRVLQRHHQAFLDMLKWQLTSRAEFERLQAQDSGTLTDLERAARFLYLQKTAFGGRVAGQTFGISTTGPGRFDVTRLARILADAHERLAGVWIECLPWESFLDRWDRPGALFYLDPPYRGTEHFYGDGLFDAADFARLADRMATLRARFLLTVNDHPDTRAAFGRFAIDEATVTYMIRGGGHAKRGCGELIVSGP